MGQGRGSSTTAGACWQQGCLSRQGVDCLMQGDKLRVCLAVVVIGANCGQLPEFNCLFLRQALPPCCCCCSGRSGLLDKGGGCCGAAASAFFGNGGHQHFQAAADHQPHPQPSHGSSAGSGSSSSSSRAAYISGAGSGSSSWGRESHTLRAAAVSSSHNSAADSAERRGRQRRVGVALAGKRR